MNDKIPPQNIDLECAVLGAILLEREAQEVLDLLTPETFYDPKNRTIFKAIKELRNQRKAVDILTVVNQLKNDNKLSDVGGAFYVSTLTRNIATTANSEQYARILMQHEYARKIIAVSQKAMNEVYKGEMDVFDLLDKTENEIKAISSNTTTEALTAFQIASENIKRIESIKERGVSSGVYAGFTRMQQLNGGWQNGDLIIIAGRPAMGKTAFAFQILFNCATKFDIPCAFFSLEMSKIQIASRMQSIVSDFSTSKILAADMNWTEIDFLKQKTHFLHKIKLFIDDTPSLSIPDFKRKARKLKRDYNVQMIVVDYLQLMRTGDRDIKQREQEISYISRSLKATAKELDLPIIALSQLSRMVEGRNSKRPMLSDLRESGAIEQDADIIIFPFRPEYYGSNTFESGEDAVGKAEIIYAKNRNGALIAPILGFEGTKTMFYDI